MKRTAFLVLAALLAAGCYHDNASPFVHGGGNKPPNWGSTWAPASGTRTETAGVTAYSASSGNAGGFGGDAVPVTTTNGAPQATTMAVPSTSAPLALQAGPATPAKAATPRPAASQ